MVNLLKSIVSAISSIFNFLKGTFDSLVNLLSKIPSFFQFLVRSISILPSIFIPFIVITLVVSILYFIIGRNSN